MTATAARQEDQRDPPRGVRVLRWAGWGLVVAGCLVLLYLAYSLFGTNLETNRAQARLLDEWEQQITVPPAPAEGRVDQEAVEVGEAADDPVVGDAGASRAPEGGAVALLEFVRPGGDERPVTDEPLVVVGGVSPGDLRLGPGHYPGTALPGGAGNFAVAGHRTTYGAPFFSLDELLEGDEVHVTGRDGQRHVYTVVGHQIVGPADDWVIGADPLGEGRPLMTLTTCHPRFSAAQRLIVFAELVP